LGVGPTIARMDTTGTDRRLLERLRAVVLDNIGFKVLAIVLSLFAYAVTHRPVVAAEPAPEYTPPSCVDR